MTDEELRALIEEAATLQVEPEPEPDGPPEDMFYNPQTGQMTSRELLANNMQPTQAEAAAVGGYQGLGFGGGDEVMGAINAAIPTGGTAAERFKFGQEYMRAKEEAARRDFPVTTGAAEAGGAIATGLTYGAPAIAKRGLGGAMAAGAGMGAAEGTVYGALSGEGAEGRAADALKYGGMGAGTGFVAPIMTNAIRGGWRMGKDVLGGGVDAVTGRASTDRANRAIAKTLMKSGRSVDDVSSALNRAAQEGQPEYRAMDAMGIAGQRRASALARSGGDSATEIREFLDQRQLDQPERMAAFVEDAFDLQGASAKATREALEIGRDDVASAAYGAARAQSTPVDVRRALGVIDDRIGGMEGSGVSGDGIDATLAKFKKRLAAPKAALKGEETARELSDFNRVFIVKQDVDDAIGVAIREGRKNEARELQKLKVALDDALADASAPYSAARDQFAASSRVIESVDQGQQMARPGNRAIDTTAQFRSMTPEQQAAARVGYGDAAMRKLEAQAGGANRARPFTSTKSVQEANAIASDPGKFQRRIGREMDMFETRNVAAGGSRTADNIEDISELQGVDAGFIASLLRGNVRDAALTAGQRGLNVATGMNDSTRQKIAQALLSGNTDALRAAVNQVANSEARRAIVDKLLRLGVMTNNPVLQ